MYEIRRKVLSKNPRDVEEGLDEMKYILSGYKDGEELEKTDFKLIAGIYKDDPFGMDEPFELSDSESSSNFDNNQRKSEDNKSVDN